MVKLQLVQLDRDIEWPGLGISGSLLRAEDKWDLQRDESFTYVSAKRAGQVSGGGLIPASRCMFVVDAAARESTAAEVEEAEAAISAFVPAPGEPGAAEVAAAEALIDAKAQKQRARAARAG